MTSSTTPSVHPLEALMLASEKYDRPDRLSAVSGVSERAIRNVITGRTRNVRLSTIKAIAPAFDVDAADLLEEIRTWQEARA